MPAYAFRVSVFESFESGARWRPESLSGADNCLNRCGRTVPTIEYSLLLLVARNWWPVARCSFLNTMALSGEVLLLGCVATAAQRLIHGTGWLVCGIHYAHRMQTSK